MSIPSNPWTRWSIQRPAEQMLSYRWRIPARPILGLTMSPEWTGKLRLCGMGYSDAQYWPDCSDWDGYRRSVPAGLEWRVASDNEKDITWVGLDLLPCPFTGKRPVVSYHGRWIGAPPFCPEYLSIRSHMVESNGWREAARMRDAWNRRPI